MFFAESTVSAFTTLVVVLDPIGLVPIFLSLTAEMEPAHRKRTAIWAAALACLVLVFFALFGAAIMGYLGISIPAFRIAGGLMLLYTSFEMVYGARHQRQEDSAETALGADHARSVAAFPLAIPLMAGPGAITACLLLAGQVRGDLQLQFELLLVIVAVCLVAMVCFLAAGPIDRLLGRIGKIVFTRLLGVLLAALAVQFIADGVLAFVG